MFRSTVSTLVLCATAPLAQADGHIFTATNEAELREALENAAAADAPVIVVAGSNIDAAAGFTFAGTGSLTLIGNGQTIATSADEDVFAANEGANLTISNLTFEGPSGFNIQNRGDADGTAGKGIFVDVRDDQTGDVIVDLFNVTVRGVANHGIHISDCTLADECGSGGGGAGEGSDASVHVILNNVTIDDAGNGKFDADGLRVDERGAGSIRVDITGSTFQFVGADGVELDEGQAGDVISNVTDSTFANNGNYCDPAIMEAFLPDPDEGEFDEGEFAEADVPPAVEGSPDDLCIEREVNLYDDGSVEEFAFGLDLDDGYDIDEAGEGSIISVMFGSSIVDNLDEGIDFDEEDGGNIDVVFIATDASGNTDDGYKFSEEGDGDTIAVVTASSALNNGGKGFVFEEANEGDLEASLIASETKNNDDGDDTGVEACQEGDGDGALMLIASDIEDGVDLDGVDDK